MVIDPNDIAPELEQRHRDAMLDLVLAWGSLDGALGILLSSVRGLPLDQGAELIGKRSNAAKLADICKALRNSPNGAEAARFMEKHKTSYLRYAEPRNRIAHSKCLGFWSRDPEYIAFATFAKVADGELALDLVPIQFMQHATRWGEAMKDEALKRADALEVVPLVQENAEAVGHPGS